MVARKNIQAAKERWTSNSGGSGARLFIAVALFDVNTSGNLQDDGEKLYFKTDKVFRTC